MKKKEKMIIGITGGVGAGKSSVLEILKQQYGAKVILADLVAHDLMEPGSEGLMKVTEALGTHFLNEDGSVNRKILAEILFHDPQALETMNAIIHPMVWDVIQCEADKALEHLIIVEAAVFHTAPMEFFDEIWYVYADVETRIQRLMESRGYTREKCESIMAQQISEERYRAMGTRVLDNNGGRNNMEVQLKEILQNEVC